MRRWTRAGLLLVAAACVALLLRAGGQGSPARSTARSGEEAPIAAGAGDAREAPAPGELADTLVIRVVDAETGAPVSGARVTTVSDVARLDATHPRSDARGEVHAAPFLGTVRAAALGYLPARTSTRKADRDVRLSLVRGVPVTGRVVRAGTGAPIAGAQIHVFQAGSLHFDGRSDGDGRFSIDGLPAGARCAFYAWKEGFGPAGRYEAMTEGRGEVVLHLGGGATMAGRVLRADGTPAAGTCVTVEPLVFEGVLDRVATRDLRTYRCEARTGANGEFLVEGIRAPAAYRVEALGENLHLGWIERVDLPAPDGRVDVEVRLAPRTTVVARVVVPPGEPPARWSLRMSPRRDGQPLPDRTDSSFWEVPEPGEYEVVASAAGWPTARVRLVARGGERNDVEVRPTREGHRCLRGAVRSETGESIEEAWIEFVTSDGRTIRSDADYDGRFFIVERAATHGTLEVVDPMEHVEPWRRAIAPEDFDDEMEIVLRPAARFVGRLSVVPASRRLVVGAFFRWNPNVGKRLDLRIDAAGRFSFAWRPGDATRISLMPEGAVVVTLDEPPLHPGETRDLGTIPVLSGETIAGRVEDDLGNPVPWAAVTVKVDSRMQSRTVITDATGRFRCDRLPPAPLQISVAATGFALASFEFDHPREAHLVRLEPLGRIEGRVFAADGTFASGATLPVEGEGASELEADSGGGFEAYLPPGRYLVGGVPVEVRARESVRVEVRLPPTPR